MLSPSWIHRSDDLAGMVTPTSEPAPDPVPAFWSTVFVEEPQALNAAVSAKAPPSAEKRVNFIVSSSFGSAVACQARHGRRASRGRSRVRPTGPVGHHFTGLPSERTTDNVVGVERKFFAPVFTKRCSAHGGRT